MVLISIVNINLTPTQIIVVDLSPAEVDLTIDIPLQ